MTDKPTFLEYLMTYGWAVLIIVVVVASLWKMGVFEEPTFDEIDGKHYCMAFCNSEMMGYDSVLLYENDIDICKCRLYKCDRINRFNNHTLSCGTYEIIDYMGEFYGN